MERVPQRMQPDDYVRDCCSLNEAGTRLRIVERHGECNHCGDCCRGRMRLDLLSLVPGAMEAYKEGRYNPDGNGVEFCFFYDHAVSRCKIGNGSDKPWECFAFPSDPTQVEPGGKFSKCTFTFTERIVDARDE